MSADLIFIRCKDPHQGHWVEPIAAERGLAVTPHLDYDCAFSQEAWVVTHIATGRKIRCNGGLTKDQALKFLARLAELPLDWEMVRAGDAETARWRDAVKAIEDGIRA